MIVKARERYVLIGSDYSQQEPKMLAVLADDENMIRAASEGKDLYTTVAARAFHTTYENCLEHFPKDSPIVKQDDGTWRYATEEEIQNNSYTKLANGETDKYKDGEWRRTQAKIILLGLMYSRGPTALAEQLGCSLQEAKSIMQTVLNAFPKVEKFDKESKEFCKKYGYTTTLWGRKRRLPDIRLDAYEFDFSESIIAEAQQEEFKQQTLKRLKDCDAKRFYRKNEKQAIIKEAKDKYGVKIQDNQGFIAKAERQVVNARVQGSAADMTKKAIIAINNNERLNELGFNAIAPIHDEILGQCPLANVKECKELFVYEMCNAANDRMKIKITTDPVVSFEWYGDAIDV